MKSIIAIVLIALTFGCHEEPEGTAYDRYVAKISADKPCEQIGDLDICLISNGVPYDPDWFMQKMIDMSDCTGLDLDEIDSFILYLRDTPIEQHSGWVVSGRAYSTEIYLYMYAADLEDSFAHEVGHVVEMQHGIDNVHDPLGLALNCGDVIDTAWWYGQQDEYAPVPATDFDETPELGEGFDYAEDWHDATR